MKPVIGLLLILLGLTIGYLVVTGRLPSGQAPTTATPSIAPQGTGSGPMSGYGAYRGNV